MGKRTVRAVSRTRRCIPAGAGPTIETPAWTAQAGNNQAAVQAVSWRVEVSMHVAKMPADAQGTSVGPQSIGSSLASLRGYPTCP
jgi:hypothetical protein